MRGEISWETYLALWDRDWLRSDHSSVGRAEDCRVLWLSLGRWFDSGWSEFLLFLTPPNPTHTNDQTPIKSQFWYFIFLPNDLIYIKWVLSYLQRITSRWRQIIQWKVPRHPASRHNFGWRSTERARWRSPWTTNIPSKRVVSIFKSCLLSSIWSTRRTDSRKRSTTTSLKSATSPPSSSNSPSARWRRRNVWYALRNFRSKRSRKNYQLSTMTTFWCWDAPISTIRSVCFNWSAKGNGLNVPFARPSSAAW